MPFPHEAFLKERRDSTLSPTATTMSKDAESSRKLFTYMVLAGILAAMPLYRYMHISDLQLHALFFIYDVNC